MDPGTESLEFYLQTSKIQTSLPGVCCDGARNPCAVWYE